ncbi:PrsW family intramembrane metalloprotease [Nocardiopsis sediminis]|uniref:PrsW family intramembrane metalloprotease n=1 Tax=Nocardiopsis sediminis TaxID=1778267 RepID=A0ABV8FEY2_9ACTN
MDEQAMITRDLVLRVCANATEFDPGWTQADRKIVVPFTAPRDTALIARIVAAGQALGVDRLLLCRTRAEYAYEPVTEVRPDVAGVVQVIRGWGDEPTDLLVAAEDFSAAVLVTATDLTVAAGPVDFLRPLIGPDTAEARTRFGEEARDQRDPELLGAAQRYGCLEQGARHARSPRGPGADIAERLAVRVRTVREKRPGAVAGFRAVRGAWGWAMLAALLLAPVMVPGLSPLLPVVIGVLWLLTQMAWLARSRTVGFATLVRVLLLGALMLWPIALAEGALAALVGAEPGGWVAATYIAVPVEEIGKLVPLVIVRLLARRRFRRLAAVDYLLLAAASGAGFQLAEESLRAVSVASAGAVLPADFGLFTLFPGATQVADTGVYFSGHGVTTALIGAALGLAVVGWRGYGAWLWLLPVAAVWVAGVEHMVFNAAAGGTEPTAVTGVAHALVGGGVATRWILLVLLVAAVLTDYALARPAADGAPPLPGEPPLAGARRWAYGRAIRSGVRVPGDIAPLFRRMALAWVRLPVGLAQTCSAVLHEFAVMLVAARSGFPALATAWRYLRERRAYAMGAARAGDKPWRRFPVRDDLSRTGRDLESALGIGTATATAVAMAAGWLMVAHPWPVHGAVDGTAYAAAVLGDVTRWYGGVPASDRAWVWVALVAVASLLGSGWAVPDRHPSMGEFLREPARGAGRFLGAFAPGQVAYAAAGLVGAVLPRGTARLLRPRA